MFLIQSMPQISEKPEFCFFQFWLYSILITKSSNDHLDVTSGVDKREHTLIFNYSDPIIFSISKIILKVNNSVTTHQCVCTYASSYPIFGETVSHRTGTDMVLCQSG